MNNHQRQLQKDLIPYESVGVGFLLAIVGGFLDAYTFILQGVFANAQTGNIVLIGIQLYNRDLNKSLQAMAPVIACILGVILVEVINELCPKTFIEQSEDLILIVEILLLFLVGFLPSNIDDSIVTVLISFISSVQIASFRRLVDSPYCTTMCTGNLRTATQCAYMGIRKNDKMLKAKSIRYFKIVAGFIIGGFIGAIFTQLLGKQSIWFASGVLVITICIVKINIHLNKIKNKDIERQYNDGIEQKN